MSQKQNDLDQSVAVALDASANLELLPYLDELLADLNELGGSTETIIKLLRLLKLLPHSTVLDLGCGKGNILLKLTDELDICGLGIDGYEPFILLAQERAKISDLQKKCEFRHGDLREAVQNLNGFDVLIYTSVGALWQDWRETVGNLRRCVRPGGYIIIEEGFIREGSISPSSDYLEYDELIGQLTGHGDRILQEITTAPEEIKQENAANTAAIRRRAERLMQKFPEKKELFFAYIAEQEQQSLFIEKELTCATWLLQKNLR